MLLWLEVILAAVVVLWLFWRLLGVVFFAIYSRPARIPINETPADFGLEYRDVEFESDDGLKLRGWLILPPDYKPGERRAAVITTHGYSTNRSDIIKRSVAVAKGGFAVFSFDWRRCGESEGQVCTGGLTEQRDLHAAIDTLAGLPEADPERIGVYGFSMGGVIATIVAAADERIKAVVADSPFVNMREMSRHIIKSMFLPPFLFLASMDREFKRRFGGGMMEVNTEAAVARLSPRPLLMLAGKKDRVVPFWQHEKIFSAAREPKRFKVNPNGGHFDNAKPETQRNVIIPFLKQELDFRA